ncbi:hypothetical protein MYSTI_06088 [Myxococcus stipitatus DSM 14675]|uniref:Uncharacterized protein n=1 Tax=Myxococcus stipitatus (strain DSM 14675 / JCM 12634 / Mx s8) TaxID=1278073 RepID=L7UEL5_MYXSD|nr:hypothetical protein [Myxococcus stipitatus]AGC47361.1 hypothetical protein MYSTI_06088 [Myxococcus stipitatus DSM 14675]
MRMSWMKLVVGLLFSAVVGSSLGRLYSSRLEAEVESPEAVSEAAPPRAQLHAPPPTTVRRTGQVLLKERLPLPPRAGPRIPVGEQLTAHGVPMNLAAFETEASVDEVFAFYARHFTSKGWPHARVTGAAEWAPHPSLGATLLDEGLQLTVMVMPHHADPGVTVILGQADMEAWREGSQEEDTADLPRYPGTSPFAVRSRDEGRESLTVSFDTRDPPARVEVFYREALAALGYVELAEDEALGGDVSDSKQLRFATRTGTSWSLSLSASEGAGTLVTAQGARAMSSREEGHP